MRVLGIRGAEQFPGKAFDVESGASLPLAFLGLKEESVAEGKVHADAAKDLQTKIADPFAQWAFGYKVCLILKDEVSRMKFTVCQERLHTTKATIVDGYLRAYEDAQRDVSSKVVALSLMSLTNKTRLLV